MNKYYVESKTRYIETDDEEYYKGCNIIVDKYNEEEKIDEKLQIEYSGDGEWEIIIGTGEYSKDTKQIVVDDIRMRKIVANISAVLESNGRQDNK